MKIVYKPLDKLNKPPTKTTKSPHGSFMDMLDQHLEQTMKSNPKTASTKKSGANEPFDVE